MLSYKRYSSTHVSLIFLCILSLVAFSPLLSTGWFGSHEGIAPLERVLALAYEISNGDYYPRWLSSAYQSQGLPFFNFYSPIFYLFAAYLYCLGMPLLLAVKTVIWVAFFSGSAGMFLWVKNYYNTTGGLISAIAYLFLPYHFLDIYVRGAMAEFAALAILPFLFYGIDISFSERALKGIVITSISTALLILTHNLSALMICPFVALYFSCHIISGKSRLNKNLSALTGPIVGLGLSAFYWLPVILERQYLGNFAKLTSGHFNYTEHFVYPSQWVSTYWGFGVSIPGLEDTMSFQIGIALFLFMLLSIGSMLLIKEMRKFGAITLAFGLTGLFMTTPASSFLYKVFPPLSYIQFPWRFLGPATMFLAAFSGLAAGLCSRFKIFKPSYLILAAILLSVLFSSEHRSVSGKIPINTIEAEYAYKSRMIGSLCMVDEYLPKWSEGNISAFLRPIPMSDKTRIDELESYGFRTSFVSDGNSSADILIPQFFFPGWKAHVDGIPTTVAPGNNGFLVVNVPPGKHKVEVWFGTTTPRVAGWVFSIFTFVVIFGLWIKKRIPNKSEPK